MAGIRDTLGWQGVAAFAGGLLFGQRCRPFVCERVLVACAGLICAHVVLLRDAW